MSTIKVTFNIDSKLAEIELNGEKKSAPINIIYINNFTQMASISWIFDDNHKWTFSWQFWANHEQFVTFSNYDQTLSDPWKEYTKWSFINKPQRGTCQKRKVYRMFNYCPRDINEIIINVYDKNFCNWSSVNCEEGYYY